MEGKWNLARFNGHPKASGHLDLKEDRSFSGEISDGTKSQSIKGTYVLDRSHLDNRSVLFVEFKADSNYGDNGIFRLALDEKNNVLYDIITLMYCRPGEESKVKTLLDRQRKTKS